MEEMVVISILLLGGAQLFYLFKKKLIKEAVTSIVLLFVSLFYSCGPIFGWEMPSAAGFVSLAFQPLVKLIFGVSLK